MHTPPVSVIIPVLNTLPYLDQCIESLLEQTLQGIEIICVDNGSEDGSLERLREYEKENEQVKVLHSPGGRLGGARNAGVAVATGQYIGFVDSDDFVAREMFQDLYSAAVDKNTEMAVCNVAHYFFVDDHIHEGLQRKWLMHETAISIRDEPNLLRNITAWNKIYARSLLERLDLTFPENIYHEDQFYVTRAYLSANGVATVPKAHYYYRKQRPGAISEKSGKESFEFFNIMEMLAAGLEKDGLSASDPLVLEFQVLRGIQLIENTRGAARKDYYGHLQKMLCSIDLSGTLSLLSPREFREYRAIRALSFKLWEIFRAARSAYGPARQILLGLPRSVGRSLERVITK